MAKGDDLEERLIGFAVRVIRMTEALPNTEAGQHIEGQLLRSGTSPAPNYGEARSAESARAISLLERISFTNSKSLPKN